MSRCLCVPEAGSQGSGERPRLKAWLTLDTSPRWPVEGGPGLPGLQGPSVCVPAAWLALSFLPLESPCTAGLSPVVGERGSQGVLEAHVGRVPVPGRFSHWHLGTHSGGLSSACSLFLAEGIGARPQAAASDSAVPLGVH